MKEDGEDPQALRDRPELDFRQAHYYSIYQACARGRPASMGGSLPIPLSEIRGYCEMFYITNLEERDRLTRYVNCLDNAYLEVQEERRKKT